MDPQITASLKQTINVAPYSSALRAGDPTFGAAVAVSAYIEDKIITVRGPSGNELKTSKLIITASAIGLQDRVWLPGDSTSDRTKGRSPVSVETFVDEVGNADHYETYL